MAPIVKPTLKRLPVDAPIAEFIDAITKDGGCICTNFVPPETIERANAEVKPWLDADKPWKASEQLNVFHFCKLTPCRENYSLQKLDVAIGCCGEVKRVVRGSSCIHSTR